jgi:hypothetical protein
MFQPNEAFLKQYYANHQESRETLVDFGVVPADLQDREDWQAEASRFLTVLAARGYQFQPTMYDGDSGLCPLYTVRLDKGDFQGLTPVDLPYFQWVVNQLCHPGQTTAIHEQILEVHVLGEGQSLEEVVPPR